MAIPDNIKQAVENIPPLSSAVLELIDTLNIEHTLGDVANIVKRDPILVAKTLSVVNSSVYALPNEIDTIEMAVSFLGDKSLMTLALDLNAGEVFNSELNGYECSGTKVLLKHSIYAAVAARELAKYSNGLVEEGVAYTVGMLLSIGKSIISFAFEGKAQAMVKAVESVKGNFLQAERSISKTDHAEVGEYLARKWKLPESITIAIKHYIEPDKAPEQYKPLAYIAHLGNFIAMMIGEGTGADTLMYSLDPKYTDFVSIKPRKLDKVVMLVAEECLQLVEACTKEEEEGGEEL